MRNSKSVKRPVQVRNRKNKAVKEESTAGPQCCVPQDATNAQALDALKASAVVDNEHWVQQNFSGCDLGHARRTKRLAIVAQNMLNSPEASLPQQNSEWSDIKAAYRLFDCEEVTFEAVRQRHEERVRQTPPGVYLMISDTTDISHFTHQATKGLGMLGDGTGRGMQLHSCLAVNAATGVVCGSAAGIVFYRSEVPKGETRMQRLARPRESSLWGKICEKIGQPPKGSQWIHVWDRGGDNFEALCHVVQSKCDWVIRASKLNREIHRNGTRMTMEDAVSDSELIGCYDLHLRARPGVAARVASLQIRSTRVTLPQPKLKSLIVKSCGIESIETNLLEVEEVNAPKDVTPIRWVLITSLPVDTLDAAWAAIGYYEKRWLIEEYHKVLKTGCSVERHSLRTAERLEPLIGLISVIGVRLLSLKTICRHEPEAKAQDRVPGLWLKVLLLMKPKLAKKELTVYEFFRGLAKLGGFLGRKHDGDPGWQTIWNGYQILHSRIEGIKLISPEMFCG
jgi:hypothetical protein